MIEIILSLVAIVVAIWFICAFGELNLGARDIVGGQPIYTTQRWKHTSTFSNLGIPGPKPSLFFGNILELYRKGPIKCHEEWIAKYGRVVGFYYGMKRTLLVADPQLLKTIYIKDFSKFVDREPFHPLIINDEKHHSEPNVLNAKGQKWKETRSVLTPTFSTAKMKRMAVTMNDSVDTMIDVFRKHAKTGRYFNIHEAYQRLTMDVIAKTAFGVITDVQTNPKNKLLKAAQIIFDVPYFSFIIFIGLCLPAFQGFFFWVQEVIRRIANRGTHPFDMLGSGVKRVIEHRKSNPEARKADLLQLMIDAKIVSDTSKLDLKKLEAGDVADEHEASKTKEESKAAIKHMSEEEVIASSIVVFLAGYETTSTALSFTCYLLAKHPDIQEKLYEEIAELINEGSKLEYATINKLPYLDKVLSESMRVYPPIYSFANRIALEDVQYGEVKIPKGIVIHAPCYILQHDPEYWRDPEVFDPERFNTKPNSDGITYLPFGIGPRNCLGMRFAQMEAKLALAHTVYNFKLHLDDKIRDNFPISLRIRTLTPTKGVSVKLEERNK